jgi:NAD(P)-dependent dehydrogenase (short-subunit alcohol dehydrogenase family)
MELAGKVALVTGASKGIGRAYVIALADAGATAVGVARTMGAAQPGSAPARNTLAETMQAAKGKGGKAHAIACDLEREDDVKRMLDEIVGNYGRIDIVVNNAGMFPHYETLDITVDEWDQNWRTNVLAPYLVMRHAARHMIAQRSGSIINLTSNSARPTELGASGHTGLLPYCVTKAALDRMTHFFSEDLKAYGIAVNGLSPGGVLTDTWRAVAPEDTARYEKSGKAKYPTPEALGPALIHLAQQSAATMTGQIVHTDFYRKTWGA